LRNELANNHGTFGLTYDPLRFGKNLASDAFRSQQVHVDTIAAIKEDLPYNKQLQDTENGDQLDLNQVALLAHSMGGIPAAVTAVSHPDETSELFLMAAVGMEEPNRLRFLPRLLPSLKNELIPPILRREFGDDARTIQLAGKSLEYYGSNLVRTAGEIASCIGADIRPHVAALKPSDVRTIMYYFEEDKLVPAHRSIEASGDLVDYFEIGIGFDHLAPQTRPVEIARNINRISEIAYHKSLAQVTQISI
jgi:pimeloyl-ACP methyl ester carboxylesterase